MTQDPRLGDLLLDWEEAQQQGGRVTAEELCRGCPELLDQLRRQIRALEIITPVLDLSAYQEGDVAEGPATSPLAPAVPGFEIVGELGRGGMGVVYKARQVGLDRLVALKMVLAGRHASPQERARFDAEARNIARLNHPHIVQIYDVDEHEGIPYFAMEFLPGGSLADALGGQPLPPAPGRTQACQAAAVLEPVARAVHHAHTQGIIHRDLKPANVLLRETRRLPTGEMVLDTPKVGDFGLARRLDQDRLTRPGSVVGTPAYMAPEQAVKDGNVGPWTDIYSLGVLLYELVTGRLPFDHGAEWEILQAVVKREPERPTKYNPNLPPALEAICLRCLRKQPAERYPSAEALADDLRRFQEGKPVEHAWGRPGAGGSRGLSRRRWLVGTALAVPAAAATAWVGFSTGWFGSRPSKPPLRVGLLHPSSGPLALSGRAVVESEQVAVEEINRAGGLLGRPVEAVVGDSGSNPAAMADEAERLIEKERIDVLIGGWSSPDRKAIEAVVARHQHLLFYPVEFEGLEQERHVVYLGSIPNQLILPVVRWLAGTEEKGKRRFFLVGSDSIYPRAVKAILEDHVPALKVDLCGSHFVPAAGADWKATAAAVAAAHPDAILNLIRGDDNTPFFRQLRLVGITPETVPAVSFSLTEKELISIDRKDMVGDYLAGSYFQGIESAANRRYLELLQAFRNQRPETTDVMEGGYVAVHLWARAVRAAGSADPGQVLPVLAGQSFEGPGGPVRLDPRSHYAWKYARVGQVLQDGSIKVVWGTPDQVRPEPFPGPRSPEQWQEWLGEWYRRWGGHWANPGTR